MSKLVIQDHSPSPKPDHTVGDLAPLTVFRTSAHEGPFWLMLASRNGVAVNLSTGETQPLGTTHAAFPVTGAVLTIKL
jgi:hypothetical protein